MIFFMLLKFSSRLKAAQYYGIALTIRSILISAISAHFLNRAHTNEADWRSIGVDVSDHYNNVQTFCKFSIAVGILSAFTAGILIYGTFKKTQNQGRKGFRNLGFLAPTNVSDFQLAVFLIVTFFVSTISIKPNHCLYSNKKKSV